MCLNFFLIKIGCDNDNTIKVDTSIVLDITNNIVQENINKVGSDTVAVNVLNINNSGTFNCPGGFNISQTNNLNVTTLNNINSVQSTEINTNMVDQVQDNLTQEQTEGILAFLNSIGQAGSVNNSTQITNKVKDAVRNAVTQELINQAWAGNYGDNILNINNNGVVEGGSCNLVQTNPFNIRVTNLVTSVQTTLQNDQFMNYLLDYVKQTQSSSSLSWLKWVFIAIIALVVLAVLGLAVYFLSGSGSKPEVNPAEQRKRELQRELILEKLQGEEGSSVSSGAIEGGQSESTLGRFARMGGEYLSRREEV